MRNVLIRRVYHPPSRQSHASRDSLTRALRQSALTADELLRHYCTVVFAQTGSYAETARRLDLDRRTVKSKVDPELLYESHEFKAALSPTMVSLTCHRPLAIAVS